MPDKSQKFPITTFLILAVTGIMTGLQFIFPIVLIALRRSPNELSDHEYWRLLTSLFVHNGGWKQIIFNFVGIAIVGTIVERIFGACHWLLLYFVCGVIGQIAGLYWKPIGAGASVAGAGLLGALALWMIRFPLWRARLGGAGIILGACALIYLRDIHGPPLLAGSIIATFLLSFAETSTSPQLGS
jgi:rhomboid protease GluP